MINRFGWKTKEDFRSIAKRGMNVVSDILLIIS